MADVLFELADTGVWNFQITLPLKTIESKLPELVKRDWLVYMMDIANAITPDRGQKSQKENLKRPILLLERQRKILQKLGASCVAKKHKGKIFFCRKFK